MFLFLMDAACVMQKDGGEKEKVMDCGGIRPSKTASELSITVKVVTLVVG
jgi:hypothetical protein